MRKITTSITDLFNARQKVWTAWSKLPEDNKKLRRKASKLYNSINQLIHDIREELRLLG